MTSENQTSENQTSENQTSENQTSENKIADMSENQISENQTSENQIIQPIFIKEKDMPESNLPALTVAKATGRVAGNTVVRDVQRIGGLWRIYLKDLEKRLHVLSKRDIIIQGKKSADV